MPEGQLLPPFPVDPATLDLLDVAIRPDPDAERSSLGDFLALMTRLGGSPDGPDDPSYHHNDVIGALLDEVRRLRDGRPIGTRYRSVQPNGTIWCESSDPADFAPGYSGHNRPGLTFERLRQWTATGGWEPWTPPAE